jgi:hypothetical protein
MALPQGINFRSTAGFVTDGTNEDHELTNSGSNDYPWTTAQGNSVGWETVSGNYIVRDRNAGIDRRLAGLNFNVIDTPTSFRIDLPATGNYNVRGAFGDDSYTGNVAFDLYDTTTKLVSLSTGTTSAASKWKDATNTEYSAAAWPGSNSPYAATFASTIMRVRAVGTGQVIAHIYVEAGSSSTRPVKMAGYWGGFAGESGGFAG